jgi:hypothetical protein
VAKKFTRIDDRLYRYLLAHQAPEHKDLKNLGNHQPIMIQLLASLIAAPLAGQPLGTLQVGLSAGSELSLQQLEVIFKPFPESADDGFAVPLWRVVHVS